MPGPSPECNKLAESSNNECSDEKEDDGTATCKICKIPWIEMWRLGSMRYTVCDEYICPKCCDKRDISADDVFLVGFASDYKY